MTYFRLLSVCVCAALLGCGTPQSKDSTPAPSAGPSAASTAARSQSAARPAVEPNEDALDAARAILGPARRETKCGPYELITDVTEERLLEACRKIGTQLDLTFQVRVGLQPTGDPQAAILLFADGRDFRAFSREEGRVAVGYAGFARPVRGYLALWVGEPPYDTYVTTLAHELTHMVQRRTFGPGLPPWLSEGIADILGDPATLDGLGSLSGLQGAERAARRLEEGYRNGDVGSLRRLLDLHRGEFDSRQPSYDYELSTLLTRYLLLDVGLKPRFQSFLERLAAGENYEPDLLFEELAVGEQKLESGLRRWLGSQ